MWGLAALAIAVPELISVFGGANWPTISNTVGHLESEHAWVRLIVTLIVVVLAYYAVPQLYLDPTKSAVVRGRQVSANGRLTRAAGTPRTGFEWYLALSIIVLVLAAVFAGTVRHMHPGTYVGAYVLYGCVAVFWVIVPSALAWFWSREVPFPTLFRTVGYLEHRVHPLAAVLLALLVILLLHLTFYPWPVLAS